MAWSWVIHFLNRFTISDKLAKMDFVGLFSIWRVFRTHVSELVLSLCNDVFRTYRVFFLTGPPQKMPRLAPPCFGKVLSMAAEKGEILNTLTFSIPMGGQSGTLMFFWNQLLTGQHLANSGEAQLKKTPCISSSYISSGWEDPRLQSASTRRTSSLCSPTSLPSSTMW